MKKIVIKIGSSVLFTKENLLAEKYLENVSNQIKTLRDLRYGIVLIISGAVAMGANFINFKNDEYSKKQAAAGIGQAILISKIINIFSRNNIQIAQLLLTKNTLKTKKKKRNFASLIDFYLKSGFVPVLNENDCDELNSFGGNDMLGAEIAKTIEASQLVILSTMNGSKFGIGGGLTKIKALEMLSRNGIKSKIENGKTKNIILNSVL